MGFVCLLVQNTLASLYIIDDASYSLNKSVVYFMKNKLLFYSLL